ncbi:MAG: hypothetical protein Q9166_001685 [cf. Caloplaca sp. 2 TL-2023]
MTRQPRGPSRGRILKSGAAHHNPNRRQHLSPNHQQAEISTHGGEGGRGRINDRGQGLRIRGRGRGAFRGDASLNGQRRSDRPEVVKIVVKGVLESDVTNERDSGLAKCREWLQEKARQGSRRPIEYVHLLSPRWEGDDLVFEVKNSDVWRVQKANGQQFRNVTLSVQRADYQSHGDVLPQVRGGDGLDLEASSSLVFNAVLNDRYDAEHKVLRLDRLGDDLRLQEIGTWNPSATCSNRTDFFQGMMRFCESKNVFASRAVKAEKVESISLTNNDLTNVAPVQELAKAFPDIRNLNLANNRFEDLRALEPFRYKFKKLEWLILSPNPINNINHASTLAKWFPSLRKLNDAEVTMEAATVTTTNGTGLPFNTMKDNFHDEAGYAESAIKDLVLGTDNDRASLVRKLYDHASTFSLSYNPSAPRLETAQSMSWEPHIKQSRNLKKAVHLGPRIQRLIKGVDKIEEAFKLLPPTQHPDLIGESSRYSFDCTLIPGVPDPQNHNASGVGGFKVDVHGSFDEFDITTGLKSATRSFDRVFILGPGKVDQPVRIISDILILRADGGHQAFSPEVNGVSTAGQRGIDSRSIGTTQDLPTNAVGVGAVNVGLSAATTQTQVVLAGEVSKATGLTIEWATTLLNDSGWDFQTALDNFKAAKACVTNLIWRISSKQYLQSSWQMKGLLQNQYFMPDVCAPAISNPTGIFY